MLTLSVFAQDIKIDFNSVPGQPYFISPQVMLDAAEINTLILRVNSKTSGTARLFWSTSYDPQFNQPKSIWFFIGSGEKNYYFNIPSQNPNWIGWVRGVALLPETPINSIQSIQATAITGNLFTNILSGWQEFWGPRGRLVIGSTINTIQDNKIFGVSVYSYIYWLLLVMGIGIAIHELLKLRKAWQNIGIKLFWMTIVFWTMLEISSMYSQYFLQVGQDWKYVGKSYEQKLEIANYGDFYPFMEFCQKQLPQKATFDFQISGVYNDIKSRYYLYPHQQIKNGDYLIVYDAQIQPEIAILYVNWKKFRNNAFIMKKRGL